MSNFHQIWSHFDGQQQQKVYIIGHGFHDDGDEDDGDEGDDLVQRLPQGEHFSRVRHDRDPLAAFLLPSHVGADADSSDAIVPIL